jgi:hypothetical protein
MMKALLCILISLFIWPRGATAQISERKVAASSENIVVLAKSDQKSSSQKTSEGGTGKAIENYEKEKLAKYKRNIGKRFLAVRTARPPEFFESPNDLKKKIKTKEKEEFQVIGVVQNQSGTMNFYKVRLEGGKIGYLGADGNNLEIRTKDGSLIRITPKVGKRTGTFREQASLAIDLVKNHLIPSDPVSKDKRSVERRMLETRATSYPKLKWRYEAKAIGNNRYRVTQIAEGESDRSVFRIWVVDLSTRKVTPGNQAAKDLYRY